MYRVLDILDRIADLYIEIAEAVCRLFGEEQQDED